MKNIENILIIIDMQEHFLNQNCSEYYNLIFNIKNKINEFIHYQFPIIFVNIERMGPVVEDLSEVFNYYDHVYQVLKNKNDGSNEIKKLLKSLNIFPSEFTICGVNKSFCVKETIKGLRKFFPNSKINEYATMDRVGYTIKQLKEIATKEIVLDCSEKHL
jgi:nicotinamidase-related amidase